MVSAFLMEVVLKVLCLSPYPERLRHTFSVTGDDVSSTEDKLELNYARQFDWLVSYGFRRILKRPILDLFPRRAINLHISFLPYNKGAHPNYWSWAERTPSGVTIHEIDAGIDTGPIIAQRMICMSKERTFLDTYCQLQREIEQLFHDTWPAIRDGKFESFPQMGAGTFHYARELPEWEGGWSAKISDVIRERRFTSAHTA